MIRYILIFTHVLAYSDGPAATRHITEFGTKDACVNAIIAETGKKVDGSVPYPKLEIPVIERDNDSLNNQQHFMRYVCVPKES